MAWIGYVLMVAGAAKQATAERELGAEKKALSQFQAAQLNTMAGQERSKAQRVAAERQRKARLAKSRALALAAASGAGAGDVGMMNIYAGIDSEGEYGSELALYEGEEKARNLEMDAAATLKGGESALRYANASAKATEFSAASSLAVGMNKSYGSNSTLTEKYAPGDANQPAQSYYGYS